MKQFVVWHEGTGYIHVFANDKEDAIEKYYDAIESMIGHHMKICSCFGEPKKLDRSKILKPVRVDEYKGGKISWEQ